MKKLQNILPNAMKKTVVLVPFYVMYLRVFRTLTPLKQQIATNSASIDKITALLRTRKKEFPYIKYMSHHMIPTHTNITRTR